MKSQQEGPTNVSGGSFATAPVRLHRRQTCTQQTAMVVLAEVPPPVRWLKKRSTDFYASLLPVS